MAFHSWLEGLDGAPERRASAGAAALNTVLRSRPPDTRARRAEEPRLGLALLVEGKVHPWQNLKRSQVAPVA